LYTPPSVAKPAAPKPVPTQPAPAKPVVQATSPKPARPAGTPSDSGTAIPLGHLPGNGQVRDILYNTIWPADAAVLKAGETLTYSGGENRADNPTRKIVKPDGTVQTVETPGAAIVMSANAPDWNLGRRRSLKWRANNMEGSNNDLGS